MPKARASKNTEKTGTRSVVISFRITEDHSVHLTKMLEQSPPVGIKSNKQFCRKIVLDYVAGKLKYKSAKDSLLGIG